MVLGKGYYACFIGIMVGLVLEPILSSFGVLMQQSGVDYYAQVHLSFWNSLIHTLFMPFTYLGFNLSVPALFKARNSWNIQLAFYMAYMVHYMSFDLLTGLLTALVYYQVIRLGHHLYMMKFTSNSGYIFVGLAISTVALMIQESLGHYIGGDDPSRLDFESIFNAILYAKFYSIQHLVNIFRR